jgi:hypothetical protein
MLSLAVILLIIAVILFVLAAFQVTSSQINLTALGLAFGFGSFLCGSGAVLLH